MEFPIEAWVLGNKFTYFNGWFLTSGPWWSHLMWQYHQTGSANIVIEYTTPGSFLEGSPTFRTDRIIWHYAHMTDDKRKAIGWICEDGQFLPSSLAGHRRSDETKWPAIHMGEQLLPPGITGREPGISKNKRKESE